MKIEKIHLRHLRMPLIKPFETSFGVTQDRECILIEVYSEGLIGYGECVADADPGYSYETSSTAWHILRDFLLPVILGRDIKDEQQLVSLFSGVRGHPMAKAGVEMALWDLKGKRTGSSLMRLIGGIQERVSVGVSIGIQPSSEALIETVENYLNQGYQRVKIKIKPGRDIQDAQAIRERYSKLLLQVDANSSYTLETSAQLDRLDDLNLLLIEQPLMEDDLWDHHWLQARLKTPICLDESILSVRHARQALEMQACRIINIKAGRVGGIHQAVAIHDHCQSKNVPVWCGGMLETGVGRASNLALASLPGFSLPGDISASSRYYEEDITNERFELNPDSTITVPDRPGLGVTINQEALSRATQASLDLR
jgi:o-succinylbenzoate synthase